MGRHYKRRAKKTPKSCAAKAEQALRICRYVQFRDKPELKHIDVSGSSIAITPTTSPTVYDIGTDIVSGSGYNDRIGDRVRLVNLNFRFQLGSALTGVLDDLCRLVIFKVKEPKGVAQTLSDIIQTNTAVTNVYSPLRWDTRANFTILYDKVYRLNNADTSGSSYALRYNYKVNIPLHGSIMKFQGDSATVNDNNLFFFIVGNNASPNNPSWSFYYRLTYTDV